MSGARQRTLYQSWGSSGPGTNGRQPRPTAREKPGPSAAAAAASAASRDGFEDEEDDDLLLVAAASEAERSLRSGPGVEPPPPSGFDLSSGDVWIYPTNYPVREYQLSMARAALTRNTLVCLPTGLGKTFIAAVLMYNYYRWFPSAKIVFMAPTKPLVAQQIEACYKVMGIPQEHMAEMTGQTSAMDRQSIWDSKRVFFLTPQVMVNDLSRGTCSAVEVKCLVVDEAHKALGNHAYCQVVKMLCNYTRQFRVLALSATPGSDLKAVQQVLSNLLIAHLEIRSEDSLDIQAYSHHRQIEKIVVHLGIELSGIQSLYLEVLKAFTRRLIQIGALFNKDITSLTKYQIVLAREHFRRDPPVNMIAAQRGMMEGDFALCISLYHGYELLLQMGTRSLYIYLKGIIDGSKGMIRARNELNKNTNFMMMYQQLDTLFANSSTLNPIAGIEKEKPFIYSHPKLQKLEDVVVDHFKSWVESQDLSAPGRKSDVVNTRVMIFSSFRDSVQEIAEMLTQHQPLVKVMTFVGHSSGKSMKGFTQKEQLEVVKRFREGGYNTLVSTCVGEEGLDIGEVDLIVCFDAQKSPIRLVQRMGRTGRKRKGRIVVILAEGREEKTYNQSQCNRKSIYKTILGNGKKSLHLNPNNPRMIPDDVNPAVHKMHITTGKYESKDLSRRSSKLGSTVIPSKRRREAEQSKSKQDGFLTPAETEIWNAKFRLKDDDGFQRPKLKKVSFESVKDDLDVLDVNEDTGAIRELSLSEWAVWQNRPFYTHLVDHSDRCLHFISIMDMIELMKQEGDDRNSLEIMSFLNTDDVFGAAPKAPTQIAPGRLVGFHQSIQKMLKSRHEKYKSISKSNTLTNDDEELSFFKVGKMKGTKIPCEDFKTAKSKTSEESRHSVLWNSKEKNIASCSAFSSKECLTKPSNQPEEQMELDMNEIMQEEVCASESHQNQNVLNKIGVETLGCFSKYRELNNIDLGYNSFVDETSVNGLNLSNLFYLPDSFKTQDTTQLPQQKCNHANPKRSKNSYSPTAELPSCHTAAPVPASIQMVLENVRAFLSESPPPLDISLLWEEVNYKENRRDSNLKTSPANIQSEQLIDDSPRITTEAHFNEPNLHPEPFNNHGIDAALSPSWDDVFDTDSEEDPEKYGEAQPSVHTKELHDPSNCFALSNQKPETHNDSLKDTLLECEESLPLFEGEQLRVDGASALHLPNCSKNHSVFQDVSGLSREFTEQLQIPKPCASVSLDNRDPEQMATRPLLSPNSCPRQKPAENVHVDQHRGKANESDVYNCSEELFSVNFDLGFSFENLDSNLETGDDLNQMYSKTANSAEHRLVDRSSCEKPEVGKSALDKCPFEIQESSNNTVEPKVTSEVPRFNRFISTPVVSFKHSTVKYGRTELPYEEKQDLTRSEHSPLHQFDQKESVSSPFSPTFVDISTPKQKCMSSSKLHSTVSFTPPSKNSQTGVPRNATRKSEMIRRTLTKSASFGETSGTNNTSEAHGNKSIFHKIPESPVNGGCTSGSEEEVIRRPGKRVNPKILESPEVQETSNIESPIHAVKKPRKALDLKDTDSDDDFRATSAKSNIKRSKIWRKQAARQFLEEEAELSCEGAEGVSSDEDNSDHDEAALRDFINDNSQLSQALNDSDMQEVYLKSVRSPNIRVRNRKASRKRDMAIFSQIPEQDETYMEDSFCVQEEENDNQTDLLSDDEIVNFDLLNFDLFNESFAEGRKEYMTRRRARTKLAGIENSSEDALTKKKKGSRIIVIEDSSEDELEVNLNKQSLGSRQSSSKETVLCSESIKADSSYKTHVSKTTLLQKQAACAEQEKSSELYSLEKRCQMRLNLQADVSEALDFQTEKYSTSAPEAASTSRVKGRLQSKPELDRLCAVNVTEKMLVGDNRYVARTSEALPKDSSISIPPDGFDQAAPLVVLVDSREVSSGPDLISFLRTKHGIKTGICSLSGCDYIVSNRMAVERKLLLEFSNISNRSKLVAQIQSIQAMFERVCIILEKDRTKAGETSRIFHRTKYFDGLLSALTAAGIRMLFSFSQEESAGLIADLARVEQRKNAAITVPPEVKGPQQHVLRFYLSIPGISYITALNLCHRFSTVKQMVNSSVDEIAARTKISRRRAEEIYRYLHYIFDPEMVPDQVGST
ncbi:Fanconi anemia group M protein [Callorhinchus milii]|uniref:Fanconi anemia group M protein n=1 Tax=Callorhinchus milii TaxID=7868 RepID=UPI001C3F7714|nr:Fanconi anemia group M protein [Callorhinchus milii]